MVLTNTVVQVGLMTRKHSEIVNSRHEFENMGSLFGSDAQFAGGEEDQTWHPVRLGEEEFAGIVSSIVMGISVAHLERQAGNLLSWPDARVGMSSSSQSVTASRC